MMRALTTVLFSCLLVAATAFAPTTQSIAPRTTTSLGMGFLDDLFGSSKKAEASHILLKGPNASEQCETLKMDIYKKAVGPFGNPANGVEPEKLMKAFAQQASAKSTCPSKAKGGSLGTFGPGQMVPEFDKVVFNEAIGIIHGPVETQFGSHLILITDREE